MKTTNAKPRVVSATPDVAMTFVYAGQSGLPLNEAQAKWAAFQAKHPSRTLRKGQKGAAELVKQARESRDRR